VDRRTAAAVGNPTTEATAVLEAGTLDYFVRDNTTGAFTQLVTNKVLVDQNAAAEGFGETIRYAFGTGGNGDLATYQLDDIVLESGLNAAFQPVPEPSALALLGAGSLLALRRRRSA
jgi:hypothetical protein